MTHHCSPFSRRLWAWLATAVVHTASAGWRHGTTERSAAFCWQLVACSLPEGVRGRCVRVGVWPCRRLMAAAASRRRRGGQPSLVAPDESVSRSMRQCTPGGAASKVPADGWRARQISSDSTPAPAPSGCADRSGESAFGRPPRRRGGLWASSRRLLLRPAGRLEGHSSRDAALPAVETAAYHSARCLCHAGEAWPSRGRWRASGGSTSAERERHVHGA